MPTYKISRKTKRWSRSYSHALPCSLSLCKGRQGWKVSCSEVLDVYYLPLKPEKSYHMMTHLKSGLPSTACRVYNEASRREGISLHAILKGRLPSWCAHLEYQYHASLTERISKGYYKRDHQAQEKSTCIFLCQQGSRRGWIFFFDTLRIKHS